MIDPLRFAPVLLLTFLGSLVAVPAQQPADQKKPGPKKFDPTKLEKEDKEVASRCAGILMRFGDFCKAQKVAPRAKESYDRILNLYDPEHLGARQALGFKKTKEGWQEAKPALVWKDKSNDDGRYKVVGEWVNVAKSLANAHRERGLKLIKENSDNPALGVYHLRCAISYNPFDKDSHEALGNKAWKSPEGTTYYGSEEEITFIGKMNELQTFALMLAKKDHAVTPVTEIPDELKRMDLEFHGAKSDHFTYFTRGTQENADNLCKWAERTLDFMEHVLGEETMKKLKIRERTKAFSWQGFVWTSTEKKDFIAKNPQLFEKKERRERADQFVNIMWQTPKGLANVAEALTPATMHDYVVGNVITWTLQGSNDCLSEGLMHATCWYLLSTCISRNGALPDKSETASGPELNLPDSTNWWLREMRDQAQSGTDFAVNTLPRVKLSKFPNDARIKTWSFMTWVLARYPDTWFTFFRNVPGDKQPFPEQIDEIGEKAFGKPLGDVEAEWREWAAGRGAIATATGYGPPLLPEKPNSHEIAAVKRLNAIRAQAQLDPSEIDAEASQACEAHAHFLNLHGEKFKKWPEAHEEDPALEGFTPRGMRAGMASVIVFGETDAADSIDGWVGTFYHRLPLLEPNTRRIGMAVEGDICVLDMGSLQDPFDPEKSPKWVPWPFKDQKDVPTHFFGNEFPNPVEEVAPKDKQSNPALGYPISLQVARHIAKQLKDGSMVVYELKKGLKFDEKTSRDVPKEAKEVPIYLHTPLTPMLKRMEVKNCICAIPKEHLKPLTNYLVRATLQFEAGEDVILWKFTTGSR